MIRKIMAGAAVTAAFAFSVACGVLASTAGAHAGTRHGWMPRWVEGARCTRGEARDFGVSRGDCVNLVGTRITVTVVRGPSGGITVHKS